MSAAIYRAIAALFVQLADAAEPSVPPPPPSPAPEPPAPAPEPPAPAPAPIPPAPPAPVPEPSPPPAPTPTAARIPALPIAQSSTQCVGPADWIDPAAVRADPVWDVFDGPSQRIARSMDGAEASEYRVLHTYGMPSPLYNTTQAIHRGKAIQVWPDFGDEWRPIQNALAQYPLRGGPRGLCIATPYCTWHGHTRVDLDGVLHDSPQIPMWVGIAWDGSVCFAFRDGSMTIPFKVPVTTYSSDFTYHEPRSLRTFFALDSAAGRVLAVNIGTTPWTVTELCSGLGHVSSIRSVGGMLYAVRQAMATDANGVKKPYYLSSEVVRIDPTTGTVTPVAPLQYAFWVDHTSDGQLVVMTLTKSVRRIDPATGAIGPELMGTFATPLQPRLWVTCDVDRAGTFGEKDAIIAIASHGTGNTDLWRITSAGPRYRTQIFGQGGSQHIGRTVYCLEPTGHYPWVAAHHPDDACILVQGFGNDQPKLIAARHPSITWPTEAPVDAALWAAGYQIITHGCSPARKIGEVPSFTTAMNKAGGSHIGISADVIAEMPFQAAAEFVRSGMGGVFRRDDIRGQHMKALLLYLYRSSLRYLREGRTLIDALMQQDFGAALPDLPQQAPIATGNIDWFLRAKPISGGRVQIEGLRPTNPTALPSDLVLRLVIDRGMSERVVDGIAAPWTVTLPALPAGQHSLTVERVSGGDGRPMWGRASVVTIGA